MLGSKFRQLYYSLFFKKVVLRIINFSKDKNIVYVCAFKYTDGYHDELNDAMSDGRILAFRNSLENAEFGFAAKRFGSSNSSRQPLDKMRILNK
jgi:hypothetical protein